jgi:hypothetical protein
MLVCRRHKPVEGIDLLGSWRGRGVSCDMLTGLWSWVEFWMEDWKMDNSLIIIVIVKCFVRVF